MCSSAGNAKNHFGSVQIRLRGHLHARGSHTDATRSHTRASVSSHDPRIHEWFVGYQWAYACLPTRVHPLDSVTCTSRGATLSHAIAARRVVEIAARVHVLLFLTTKVAALPRCLDPFPREPWMGKIAEAWKNARAWEYACGIVTTGDFNGQDTGNLKSVIGR